MTWSPGASIRPASAGTRADRVGRAADMVRSGPTVPSASISHPAHRRAVVPNSTKAVAGAIDVHVGEQRQRRRVGQHELARDSGSRCRSGLAWQPATASDAVRRRWRCTPERPRSKVRPWLRRRGISCTFYHYRRDTDRCDRLWADRGASACSRPGAGCRRRWRRAARRRRPIRSCAAALPLAPAAALAAVAPSSRCDLHVEQLLADVAADAAHHLAEDRRSLPSCTPASDPSGRSRAGRCPRAAPPST